MQTNCGNDNISLITYCKIRWLTVRSKSHLSFCSVTKCHSEDTAMSQCKSSVIRKSTATDNSNVSHSTNIHQTETFSCMHILHRKHFFLLCSEQHNNRALYSYSSNSGFTSLFTVVWDCNSMQLDSIPFADSFFHCCVLSGCTGFMLYSIGMYCDTYNSVFLL